MRTRRVLLVVLFLVSPSRRALGDALTLDVFGTVRTTRDFGREYRAMLQVGVDWETLLFGRDVGYEWIREDPSRSELAESNGFAEPTSESRAGAPPPESEAVEPEASRTSSGSREPEGRTAPAPPAMLESRPAWARPAFALELVRVVMNLERQGESRADSLATRSRTSALLPVLRLRAGRGTDQSLRYSPTLDDPDRWLVSGGADYSYEAQATWSFDRLVFAGDEIAVERLRQQAAKARGDRALRALEVLFGWQQARLRLDHEALSPEDALELQIKLLQAECELDVLTRGWFSKRIGPP